MRFTTASSSSESTCLTSRIGRTASTVFMALACAVMSLLALMALFITGTFNQIPERTNLLVTDESMTLNHGFPSMSFLIGIILLVGMFCAVAALWSKHSLVISLPAFVAMYALSVSLIWLFSLHMTGHYGYSDSKSLIEAANSIVSGRDSDFAPNAPSGSDPSVPISYMYFSWYPFQTGALLWFVLIFKLFGSGNVPAFLAVNSFLLAGIACMLQIIGERLGLSEYGQRIEALLILTSIPFLLSGAFAYTNTAGFFFATLALLTAFKAARQTQYLPSLIWTAATFFIGTVAVMVKGTMIIYLIAFALVLSIVNLRSRLFWMIPVNFILLLAANKGAGLSLVLVERLTGQQFGEGLPQLSWIAMGLSHSDEGTGLPGWWTNSALQAYRETDGDTALQKQIAMDTIIETLRGFINDPGSAVVFFVSKLATEWTEPTYQTLYYSSLAERGTTGTIAEHIFYGRGNRLLLGFTNAHQSLVYLLSTAGFGCAIHRIRQEAADSNPKSSADSHSRRRLTNSTVMLFLAMILLGGFGCFLLWEAKSTYVLSFAIMLIPVAAYGLEQSSRWLHQRYDWKGLLARVGQAVGTRRH